MRSAHSFKSKVSTISTRCSPDGPISETSFGNGQLALSWLSSSHSLFGSKDLHCVLSIDVARAAPDCGRSYYIPTSACEVSVPLQNAQENYDLGAFVCTPVAQILVLNIGCLPHHLESLLNLHVGSQRHLTHGTAYKCQLQRSIDLTDTGRSYFGTG